MSCEECKKEFPKPHAHLGKMQKKSRRDSPYLQAMAARRKVVETFLITLIRENPGINSGKIYARMKEAFAIHQVATWKWLHSMLDKNMIEYTYTIWNKGVTRIWNVK